MKHWFLSQPRRDQLVLLLGLLCVLLSLLWFAVLGPLQGAVKLSDARLLTALNELAEVRQLVTVIRNQQQADTSASTDALLSSSLSTPTSAASLLDRSAAEFGLRLAAVEPVSGASDETTVRVREAPVGSVLQWLYDVESNGLRISQLSLTPTQNGAGQVDLAMRVRP
ncbi:MAG: type II secretion system protein GspM [Pseudohongiellaceae bacterium]